MSEVNRLDGGLIDRTRPMALTFNGSPLTGYRGDTLASALLANGRRLVARSFKYHRPRGIFSAGPGEPNALVTVRHNGGQTPNLPATTIELFDGLDATSQNHLGPLSFDLLAVNDWLSPLLGAGFYYKTFMWPKSFWEKVYEPVIRRAAGLGRLGCDPDSDVYDRGYLHCDVLIIGAGPAGLSAARVAGRSGARVIIADDDFRAGGQLNAETFEVDGLPGSQWAERIATELADMDNVRLLTRTAVVAVLDHGQFAAVERRTDHQVTSAARPVQLLWRITARRCILCSGASERSIGFAGNDRPGIMLASAVRAYVNRWGVAPGKRVTVFTNNDDGWRTAGDLSAKGVEVAAIVDTRAQCKVRPQIGIPVHMQARVASTSGRLGLRAVVLSNGQRIKADCLAVSGGWNPNVQLSCHLGSKPVWRDAISAFVPGDRLPSGMVVAGAGNGTMTLAAAIRSATVIAEQTTREIGFAPVQGEWCPKTDDEPSEVSAFWHVAEGGARAWLDLQNDVTVKDVNLALREGFRSAEHLKRYTTLGMATDQGRTANVLALAIMAEQSGQSISDLSPTTFRPPYTPVSIGTFAGRARGLHYRPTRRTPSHGWAQHYGATFVEAGLWLRAQYFTRAGESHWRASVDREVSGTRSSVGICDVTTLGKIDIQGQDAAVFVDRVYANTFSTLKVGRVRYGIMLREDGFVMDDGTTARLSDAHFLMTTTTANAAAVLRHLEFCRQCLWPDLDVHLESVTEQWAQFSVAGPNSRRLLESVVDARFDLSNAALPLMACRELTICNGVPARLFRLSFSGELAFEIAVPARYGDSLVRTLMAQGKPLDVVAYGTEALGVMRIEKGHPAGNELNGQTTARDLGLERMTSKRADFIGKVLSRRPELISSERPMLTGFRPIEQGAQLFAGAHLFSNGRTQDLRGSEGWISSTAHSPTLGHAIGLGFLRCARDRLGEIVVAADPLRGRSTTVEVVSQHFVDPDGERMRV